MTDKGILENPRKRLEEELPDMKYITRWEYHNRTVSGDNGDTKHGRLRLRVTLPEPFIREEEMRRLLIENKIDIYGMRKTRFWHGAKFWHRTFSPGGNGLDKSYSLLLRTIGLEENKGTKIEVLFDYKRLEKDKNIEWDYGLVGAVAGYVKLYEEDKRKKEEEKLKAKREKEEAEKPKEFR